MEAKSMEIKRKKQVRKNISDRIPPVSKEEAEQYA